MTTREPRTASTDKRSGQQISLHQLLRHLIWWCMLPLALLAGWLAYSSVGSTRAGHDQAAQAMAAQIATAVDQALQARLSGLAVLASAPALDDAPRWPNAYQQAQALEQIFGSPIILADLQGQMLFNTLRPMETPLPVLPAPGQAAASRVVASGRPAVSDVFLGPISQQRMVALAVPVQRQGQTTHVLLTQVTVHQWQALLDSVSLPPRWAVSLKGGSGTLIAQRGEQVPADHPQRDSRGAFTVPSEIANWSVELEIHPDVYRAPVRAATLTLALALLGTVLIGLLGGSVASRRLTRSIASLTQKAPGLAETGKHIREVVAVRQLLDQSSQDRDHAVTALGKSQATFQAIFQGLLDAAIYTNLERQIQMVNPAFTRLFGYPAEEVLGRTTEFLYAHPADFHKIGRERFDRAGQAEAGTYTLRYRHRNGDAFWAESSGLHVRDNAGQLVGMLGTHRDIEVRKRAEEAIAEAHARFAAVFHSSPLGMAIGLMSNGTFLDINAALERMIGHTHGDVVGKTGRDIRIWVDMDQRDAVLRRLSADGVVLGLEARFQRRSGAEFDGAFTASRFEVDGVAHFLGMVDDISLQKRAQRELDQHHRQLELLVAQRTAELAQANQEMSQRSAAVADLYNRAPCGYFSLDAQQRICEVNDTTLLLLGYSREELLGQPVTAFMPQESQAEFAAGLAQAVALGLMRDLDCELSRHDGGTIPLLMSAEIERNADGEFTGARATLVDNRERKARDEQIAQMQQELARRAEEAEASNRAKSAFLANMSHEIRTPMNAIIGLTHMMSRDERVPVQRDRLGKLEHSAKHLLQVINDILDLSKIEAGQMALENIEFSLDSVLAKVFEMVGTRASEKGLELILDTDRVPDRLRGDPTRLSQALINLLSNAVKFTAHGWVRLRAELMHEERYEVGVRFEVTDTGEGIATGRQRELFSAFQQADNSMSRRHGGTGLGLALTRHLANLMGGEVGLTSAPGVGSTFWMTARLGRADLAGNRVEPIPLAGLSALLVDDLPEALCALTDRLRLLGLDVHACASGAEALARAEAQIGAGQAYDLVVVDWRMEPMDGIETLERLRQLLGAGMPPSILVTAFDLPLVWQQSRQARVDALLVKPISTSTLHDALARAIRGREPADATKVATAGRAEQLVLRRHGGQRVLLAEDNLINREVACELLRAAGLIVETAEDGMRASELACSRQYDLVLMDVQMPEMDGLAATRLIRQRIGESIPVVAMTANAFGEDRNACLNAGMNDHVAKPVDPERLYQSLLRWLPLPAPAEPPVAGTAAGLKAGSDADTAGPSTAEPPEAGLTEPALLLDRLGALDGFDASLALRNVGGQMPALERVLASFARSYAGGEPLFLQLPTSADMPRWRAACHSLRGVCATLGATQLLDELTDLQVTLQSETPSAELAAAAQRIHGGLSALSQKIQTELAR